jgi:hypothetical protein
VSIILERLTAKHNYCGSTWHISRIGPSRARPDFILVDTYYLYTLTVDRVSPSRIGQKLIVG